MDSHASWLGQQPPPPRLPHFPPVAASRATTTIEAVESAIRSLVGRWQRRRRWQQLLGCCPVGPPPPAGVGERATWRARLAAFLESTPVHLATLCLLLIDLILTALDLSASLLSCSRGGGGERFYRWCGIGILCLLSTKIAALAVALGVSFLRSPGHVVDAVVVVGALLLELLKEGAGGDAGGLLVVVSLWRVVRVVEGAFELSNEAIEERIEEITSQFQVLKAENRRLEGEVLDKDKRIAELEQQQLALLHSAAPQ